MQAYFIADGGTQRGPIPLDQLRAQGLTPDKMVWTDGMPGWLPAHQVPEVAALFGMAGQAYAPAGANVYAPPMQAMGYAGPAPSSDNKKLAAGLCAILLGTLGIHKFVLGYPGTGILMICISVLTCGLGAPVMHIIGIIEGIIYLTKSDEEFHRTYVLQQRTWF